MQRRVSSPEVVGRERELGELDRLVAEVGSAGSRFVLLVGEAGVGKSRVVGEVVRRAEDAGLRTLVGRCVGVGGSELPFAPLAQILRELSRVVGHVRLPELLGPGRAELARIVPELGEPSGQVVGPGGQQARARLFDAFADALRAIARERPLLVVLEDLHWADRSTLEVLGFVAQSLGDERIVIVATVRDEEVAAQQPLQSMLGELVRLPQMVRVYLEPLDAAAVTEQITGILGVSPEPGLAARIAARSGGNPFFVEELVAARPSQDGAVPRLVGEVVAARLDGLPHTSREVVAAAAVLGEELSHEVLASVCGLPREVLVGALRSAVEQQVLAADGDRYRFRHALVREVAEGHLLPAERVDLHRRVAETLTDRPELATGGQVQLAAELARHWHAAREWDRAFVTSLEAAEQAQRATAPAESLVHFERALALWEQVAASPGLDRIEVLVAAADQAREVGEVSRAAEFLRTALEHDAQLEAAREADLRQRLAGALSPLDRAAAVAEAGRARDLVAELGASSVRARVLARYATEVVLDPVYTPGDAIGPAREAVAAAHDVSDIESEVDVLGTLGWALGWVGELDEALASLDQARALSVDLGDARRRVQVSQKQLVVLFAFARRDDEAYEIAEELAAWLDADRHRSPAEARNVAGWLGYVYLRTGEWHRVERALRYMADTRLEGVPLAWYYHVGGLLRWMQGRVTDAAVDAERFREVGALRFAHDQFPLEAELAAAQGRLDAVRALAAEYLAMDVDPTAEAMKTGVLLPLVRAEVDQAVAARGDGRDEHGRRAEDALERMRELVERFPPPPGGAIQIETPTTWVQLAEAELTRLTGAAPGRWRAVLAAVSEPYWQVYARWRLAEACLTCDERDAAIQQLGAAHEQAIELGADGLRDDIESLARRARLPLAGVAPTDPGAFGLTRREREILALVARGRSNPEIGEQLFISPKTASVHVSNLLAKSGCSSRNELIAWALREGLEVEVQEDETR